MNLSCQIKVSSFMLAGVLFATFAQATDDLIPGPGLLTGKSGEATLYETNVKPKRSEAGKDGLRNSGDSTTEYDEFLLFKEWREAKANNNKDYQEFRDWVEYRNLKNSAKN